MHNAMLFVKDLLLFVLCRNHASGGNHVSDFLKMVRCQCHHNIVRLFYIKTGKFHYVHRAYFYFFIILIWKHILSFFNASPMSSPFAPELN
jgi:hypothetical protein